LHRIAFPVVSDWCKRRHTCFTILLARGTHPKYVQHLLGHASIKLNLNCYSDWLSSMGTYTASVMDDRQVG
jgi:integrase